MSVAVFGTPLQIGITPSLATAIPPAVVLFVVAAAVALLPRRAGHAVAVVAGLSIVAWLFTVPAGVHLPVQFLGFEAVLFRVDTLSRLLGVTFGVISAITAVYAYGSGRESIQTAFALSYAGTATGVVFAGDWLTLLAFWEVMSVISALILWQSGGSAVRAGFRYAVFHVVGGTFLVGAIAVHYVAVESFLFSAATGIEAGLPAALAAVGIGVNVGFVALHTWIPDAYPKPHFVTSVVLCGYTTKVAVYTLYRAFPDGHIFIAYMGVGMTLFGVTYALVQTNMRRLLSYHIQSQVGYMVAGIGIGTTMGVAGGFAHLVNNILYKSLLFMVAGVIIYRTGRDDLKKIGGLYRAMPLTFVAFLAAAFAIVGVPGTNGFISKEMVKTAAKKEHLTTLKWLLTAAGVGTTMSFVKFGYYAFFHGDHDTDVQDATSGQSVAMVAIAVLCILFGVIPGALLGLLPGDPSVIRKFEPYAMRPVLEALAFVAIGVGAFFLVRTQLTRLRNLPDIDNVYNPVAFYSLRALANDTSMLATALKQRTRALGLLIRTIGTAPDPVSRVTGGRVSSPSFFGIGRSVMLLATLAVVLLVALLVT